MNALKSLIPLMVSHKWKFTLANAILALLLVRHSRFLRIILQTLPRDVRGIVRYFRGVRQISKHQKYGDNISQVFDSTVAKYPSKICFRSDGGDWTFLEVWELSNQVGNFFLLEGYTKGDVIALFMENRPEYISIWLGLSKIGVITYLVNSNLRQTPLKHSFEVGNCKAVIYGEELAQPILEIFENELKNGEHIPLFSFAANEREGKEEAVFAGNSNWKNLNLLQQRSVSLRDKFQQLGIPTTNPVIDISDKQTFLDTLFCIFTSGTTGLPKAAIIKHSRFIGASIMCHHLNKLKPDDVIYTCLPLYHTAAEFFGIGQALVYGNTVVLRKKFSAKLFWKDCVETGVTVAQHIGELCRYLLSQPVIPEETQHKVRLMVGNGLRPEIWRDFVTRFKIKQITEAYGSTEGNCNMLNFDNRVGAVGFVPILFYKLYPLGLFQIHEETGEVIRNEKTGKALRCKPGEVGELLGKIVKDDPYREFYGYAKDSNATHRKIVADVFSVGDTAFRTGDFLIMDEFGYFFFKDRTGDTFRWKGENVSTAEVEGVLSRICGLTDCAVYGISIPGTDGKAGMATIGDPNNSLDLNQLADGVKKALPPYAIPLFVRLSKKLESTGTHKLRKVSLLAEGFDVTKIQDHIFFFTNGTYVRLDGELYFQIIQGKIRV